MKTVKLNQLMEKTLDDIRQMRDEIRVQLHLANMDAKVRWEKEIEPMFFRAEKVAGDISETAYEALQDIGRRLREFRASIKDTERPAHP